MSRTTPSRQATLPSAALHGLEVYRVRVEVAITRGTPMIQVRGRMLHAAYGADGGATHVMGVMQFATSL